MTTLAPLLETFFSERLLRQRRASPHTIAAYRDTFRLLLCFAQSRLAKPPSQLSLGEIDVTLISAFLDHLENERHDSIRTRNARLAAVRSFFRYISTLEPAHSAMIQRVLALPQKRFERKLVTFLTPSETEALLAASEQRSWLGRRDHALLLLALTTGLRVGEIVGLRCEDLDLGHGAHVRCHGKGRKERCTPLTPELTRVMRAWLRGLKGETLFPSLRNRPLSSDAVQKLVAKYAIAAGEEVPFARDQTHHTPRAASHRRRPAAPGWRRSQRHCVMAWARADRDDTDVSRCRPLHERTRTRENLLAPRTSRPLSAQRPATRLPSETLIMPPRARAPPFSCRGSAPQSA